MALTWAAGPVRTRWLVRTDSAAAVGASIHDGDYAILQITQSRTQYPNDIVAALIDGEATLKRYLIVRGDPCLRAQNPKYPDLIPARELLLQGVYLGLLRGDQHLAEDLP